jgi:hypothetical protein
MRATHLEAEAHNAMEPVPGLATPWPHPKRFPITRRLFAWWRWEHERGPESDAARNAHTSLANRVAVLGVDIDG